MSFVDELLAGGRDYRVTGDLGGAVFAPINDTYAALEQFQRITSLIEANDGLGYDVVHRLTHQSSDHGSALTDRMVINIHR